jgi:transcriptional antiterminator NusG
MDEQNQPSEGTPVVSAPAVASGLEMNWYIVHTYSGFEHKAKLALEERIKSLKKEKFFGEVIVPEENVVELVKGQKKTTKRRFFPGYILVKMNLTDETWHIVKNTPKITGFVGDKLKPVPVPESEVQKMTNRIAEGQTKPRPRVSFQEGENVRVVDGPFQNFSGVIEDVNADKGKVKVLVSIFGRSTPVELDFIQVEKV